MSLVTIGKHTYGADSIKVQQWGEGAKLYVGKFCSVASKVEVIASLSLTKSPIIKP